MSKITLSIAHRNYTVSCGAGEEAHVAALGKVLDEKLALLGITSGQDSQKLLFAGLAVADELHDSKIKLSSAHADAASARIGLTDLEDNLVQAKRDVTLLQSEQEAARNRMQQEHAQAKADLAQSNLALSTRDNTIARLRREIADAAHQAEQLQVGDAPVSNDLATSLEHFADLLEDLSEKLAVTPTDIPDDVGRLEKVMPSA